MIQDNASVEISPDRLREAHELYEQALEQLEKELHANDPAE